MNGGNLIMIGTFFNNIKSNFKVNLTKHISSFSTKNNKSEHAPLLFSIIQHYHETKRREDETIYLELMVSSGTVPP